MLNEIHAQQKLKAIDVKYRRFPLKLSGGTLRLEEQNNHLLNFTIPLISRDINI